MFNWTVGVYGVFGGSGRGPWMETTRRVEGDDVSMYADPGAVVIRLVRRTRCQPKTRIKRYRFSVVLAMDGHVSAENSLKKGRCMRIEEERGMMRLVLRSVVCRRLQTFSLKVFLRGDQRKCYFRVDSKTLNS